MCLHEIRFTRVKSILFYYRWRIPDGFLLTHMHISCIRQRQKKPFMWFLWLFCLWLCILPLLWFTLWLFSVSFSLLCVLFHLFIVIFMSLFQSLCMRSFCAKLLSLWPYCSSYGSSSVYILCLNLTFVWWLYNTLQIVLCLPYPPTPWGPRLSQICPFGNLLMSINKCIMYVWCILGCRLHLYKLRTKSKGICVY